MRGSILLRGATSPPYRSKGGSDKGGATPSLQTLVSIHYNNVMDPLVIAGREFRSRLIVGTGKYKSGQEIGRAHV